MTINQPTDAEAWENEVAAALPERYDGEEDQRDIILRAVKDMAARETQEPTDAERAVRDLHRRFGVYEHEDACPDTSDGHREEHHHEDSDGYGEFYCDQRPLYAVCDTCRDEDGERVDWPCPTIQALDVARAARRDAPERTPHAL